MEKLSKDRNEKEEFTDKSVHQTYKGTKPVGYGSSIQNSGNGNKTRPAKKGEDDVDSQEQKSE